MVAWKTGFGDDVTQAYVDGLAVFVKNASLYSSQYTEAKDWLKLAGFSYERKYCFVEGYWGYIFTDPVHATLFKLAFNADSELTNIPWHFRKKS